MTTGKLSKTPQPSLIPRFLLLTFGISWGFWALAIAAKQLLPDLPLHDLLAIIASFGPAIAACRVLQKSWRDLPSFIFSGRKKAWIYTLIFAGSLTLIPLLASVSGLRSGALAQIPVSILFVSLVGGGNEEPGWRGFLQPALEKRYSFPLSTLIVGIVWAIWHLPLWIYDRGETSFPLFTIIVLIFSVWFAGLYKKTQSLIACVLVHAVINTVPGSFQGVGEAMGFGDLSSIRPLVFFGGVALLTAYSIYLWYQTDRREKAQANIASKS